MNDLSDSEYKKELEKVRGLEKLVNKHLPNLNNDEKYLFMEFALHGLAEYSMISKHKLDDGQSFKDLLSGMINIDTDDDDEDDENFF